MRLLEILGFGPVALSEPVEAKQDLAAGFGADILVDLLKENIAMHTVQGGGYETVFECSGAPCAVPDAMSCCADRSTVCIVSMIMRNIEIIPMVLNDAQLQEIRLIGSYSKTCEENRQCLDWMGKGLIDGRPMITDEIPLRTCSASTANAWKRALTSR